MLANMNKSIAMLNSGSQTEVVFCLNYKRPVLVYRLCVSVLCFTFLGLVMLLFAILDALY